MFFLFPEKILGIFTQRGANRTKDTWFDENKLISKHLFFSIFFFGLFFFRNKTKIRASSKWSKSTSTSQLGCWQSDLTKTGETGPLV